MAHTTSPPRVTKNFKHGCCFVHSSGEASNMAIGSNCLPTLGICILDVIQFLQVCFSNLNVDALLTMMVDHDYTELKPKNIALFVSVLLFLYRCAMDKYILDALSPLGDRQKENAGCRDHKEEHSCLILPTYGGSRGDQGALDWVVYGSSQFGCTLGEHHNNIQNLQAKSQHTQNHTQDSLRPKTIRQVTLFCRRALRGDGFPYRRKDNREVFELPTTTTSTKNFGPVMLLGTQGYLKSSQRSGRVSWNSPVAKASTSWLHEGWSKERSWLCTMHWQCQESASHCDGWSNCGCGFWTKVSSWFPFSLLRIRMTGKMASITFVRHDYNWSLSFNILRACKLFPMRRVDQKFLEPFLWRQIRVWLMLPNFNILDELVDFGLQLQQTPS